MKFYLRFLCMIFLINFLTVLGSGEGNGIQDVLQSIIKPAQEFQNTLDEYLDHVLDDKSVKQNDEVLKERIFNGMREKMQVLIELRRVIEDGGIERKSSTSFQHCCGIETPNWSPIHGDKVNVNEWCLDGDVLQDNAGHNDFDYLTEDVMAEFVRKYKEWEGIVKYMYYGTEEGVLFNMPALDYCGEFDPRLRPWYVEAATPKSKDIIIMLDFSNSMTDRVPGETTITYLWLAKRAATTIIDILNPRDRVTVIAFNSEAIIPDARMNSDCEGQLLNLTTPNKQHLKNFVESLHGPDQDTSYVVAFKTAFDIFQRSPLQDENRDRAILMLTDGRPEQENITDIYDTIREGNSRMRNSVVIFTYGIGDGDAELEGILKNISRQAFASDPESVKAGPYTRIEDANNIRLKMAQFSDFYKAGESSTRVAFLTPYNDKFRTGMQVPMCVQVQKQHLLHGILCIDTALSDYFDTLPSYGLGSATSYAFVINEEAKTMIHPLLPITEVTNNVIQVPIEPLEVSPTPYLERLKSEESGEINLTSVVVVKGMGNVEWEGVRYEKQSATFRWFALKGENEDTGYIMVTVNPVIHEIRRASWTETNFIPECVYHKDNMKCKRHYENRYVSDGSFIHFTNDAFLDQKNFRERDSLISSICRYLTRGTSNEYFKEDVRDIYLSGAYFDSIVSSNDLSSEILYYQLVTNIGVHRVYPGMTLPDDYNPYDEAWYQRCKNSNGNIVLGVPVKNPLGLNISGISICQPLFYDSEDPKDDFYGAFNIVVKADSFWKMITRKTTECNDLHGCFLVNDAGLIVLHSDWFHGSLNTFEAVHLMKEEPYIARRYSSAIQECVDVTSRGGPKLQKSWRLQPAIDSRTFTGFSIEAIPNTNLYLVIKTEALDDDPCYCGERSETNQCDGDHATCFCPCYENSIRGYNPCTGEYSFTSDSPVPCTPETRTFDFSDVIQSDMEETELCVSPTEKSKANKKTHEETNTTTIIASVLAVLLVAAIAVILIIILCRYKRKHPDETYADMIIPSNMLEAGGSCIGSSPPPAPTAAVSSMSPSSGYSEGRDYVQEDEKRNDAVFQFDMAMGAPIPCEHIPTNKNSGSTGMYIWHSKLDPRLTTPGNETEISALPPVPSNAPSADTNKNEHGYMMAKECSVNPDPADPKSTSSIEKTVEGEECPHSMPSHDIRDPDRTDIDSDYLTVDNQGHSNPAFKSDCVTNTESSTNGDTITEV